MSANRNQARIAFLCAALVLVLGVVTLFGWTFGVASIVRMQRGLTPMVVNTAVGFVLSGAALLFAALQSRRWAVLVATILGLAVALLAIEELGVLAFDLSPAFSLPELHRPLQPDYVHPGRMAPNTALCFLLFGVALAALMRSREQWTSRWANRAAFAIEAIGVLGVTGYFLQLEYLYNWSGFVRMAVHTGLGMIVLGAGLRSLTQARAEAPQIVEGTEVDNVFRTATFLLLLIAASAGIGGFGFLQTQVQLQARNGLLQVANDRIVLFDQSIQTRGARARAVSDDEDFVVQLRALAQDPRDVAALAALRRRAERMHANGFSSISVDVAGGHWQIDGLPVRPTIAVPLRGVHGGWLLWKDGYVLRQDVPVRDAGGTFGTVITEQPLRTISEMGAMTRQLGDSGEMAVCVSDAAAVRCFPERNAAAPQVATRTIDGQSSPMNDALHGKSGSMVAFDASQHRVLAAYGPVGDTGLGIVVKQDIGEIYAPIRQQFQIILIFLGALLLFGLWLMRRKLHPLLEALETSREQARSNSARFEAAVESNLDAFFILECVRDANGRIVDMRYTLLNAGGEEMLAMSRVEVVGHGMCELFPTLRDDGLLVDCMRVVETGEPAVIERTSVVRQMHWYHMQMVKLGDGVGLTVRDVTAAHLAAERIRHQAFHDPLTGLANRAGFEQALAKAVEGARQAGQVVALGLLDLDRFKQVNDTLGHAAGDALLKEVATRLRDCVRPSDIVARLGGDEFVLVLPGVGYPDGAATVARKIIERVARPIVLEGQTTAVTVSIGISAFPQDGADATTLLKSADDAMYRAKSAGRNGYAIHGPMSQDADTTP